MPRVFHVPKPKQRQVDLNKPPTSAVEYLLQVAAEREQLEKTLSSESKEEKKNCSTAKSVGEHNLDDNVSQEAAQQELALAYCKVVEHFEKFRHRIPGLRKLAYRLGLMSDVSLPRAVDEKGWKQFFMGIVDSKNCAHSLPLLSIVLSLDDKQIKQAIIMNLFVLYSHGYHRNLLQWLYALLALTFFPFSDQYRMRMKVLSSYCSVNSEKLLKSNLKAASSFIIIREITEYLLQHY
ncbi:hypothetical protein T10_6783 [Trichinella papuae]|uniref:Gem-associated protein 2 n=1 Tax=Trichinella papuae TaxID=268474 RepID=A0A0V1MWH4_9BILA|nr:hypothetical protein T10_6783 [Trichinella papuae]KRZ75939.1 hypothetical protein T10_6783 [Trichinella papuae]KRZ75940.1 hypothetical protein T10_6783 [Trichinella papuae]